MTELSASEAATLARIHSAEPAPESIRERASHGQSMKPTTSAGGSSLLDLADAAITVLKGGAAR